MALPVLDGNQTATTLSSVVTGGEHIVAHSVVSLGANAIANITSAVSGSVVSVSNFPASQSTTFGAVTGSVSILNFPSTQTIAGTVTANVDQLGLANALDFFAVNYSEALPVSVQSEISGTVTAIIGNTVTVGTYNATYQTGSVLAAGSNISIIGGYRTDDSSAFPISVTSQGRIRVFDIQNSVTIGSVPNGSLTTRFGTPTTANTAFATSCVTNANRKYLLIQNVTTGSNVITVGIGFTPTTTQGIQLTAGAGITFESSYIPTGAVQILSSVTASNFTILEA